MADYETCIDCGRQWEARWFNDIGICTKCRLTVMLYPPNPLLPQISEAENG